MAIAKHMLVDRINTAFVEQHPERDRPFRSHLGGSMIGRKCERELYYSFRWFRRPTFDGRMLRLFARGHKEEFSFVSYLRSLGIVVQENAQSLWYHAESDCYVAVPWEDEEQLGKVAGQCDDVTGDEAHTARAKAQGVTVKQWQISDVDKHFGGSLDGIAIAPFPIPVTEYDLANAQLRETGRFVPAGEPFLNEFKTHSTKSFVRLVNEGMKVAKPEHWAQMQIYMHKKGLRFALYMAVNKNDDDLWIEVIDYDPECGPVLLAKARGVIYATRPPERIGKNITWHECKFCDFKLPCHNGDYSEVDRNCRSCANSAPVAEGEWHCSKWDAIIPSDALLKGCDAHRVITD